ncbi:THAP domain-containing protein 1-like [Anabrus simplex]|uniref:THAP domain-containing protein 1-like n=1 Tax=Anabrus simplex TaxID=316456 RepID=UPI0035A3BDBB
MAISCCAYGCSNRMKKKSDESGSTTVHFHRFPFKRPEILKKWTAAVRRKNWEPTRYSYLCSEHFSEECYKPGKSKDKPLLKDDAVPNIPQHFLRPSKRKKLGSPICDDSPPKDSEIMGEPPFIKREPDSSDVEEPQTVEAFSENFIEMKIEPADIIDNPSGEEEIKDGVKEELHIQAHNDTMVMSHQNLKVDDSGSRDRDTINSEEISDLSCGLYQPVLVSFSEAHLPG